MKWPFACKSLLAQGGRAIPLQVGPEGSLAALPFAHAQESLSPVMLTESALVPDMAVSGTKNLRKPKRIFMAWRLATIWFIFSRSATLCLSEDKGTPAPSTRVDRLCVISLTRNG